MLGAEGGCSWAGLVQRRIGKALWRCTREGEFESPCLLAFTYTARMIENEESVASLVSLLRQTPHDLRLLMTRTVCTPTLFIY